MKKVLAAFAMALLLVSCAKEYDDSALANRVTTLETKVGNLEAQMTAVNAVALGQYVQKVEQTEEGVTITYGDGTVVTLKISAETSGTGVLGVVKNANGDLCWAIDGTILQYEGKDLLVGAVSNIYVEDGKLFAVINGEAKELGGFSGGASLQDGIFTGIEVTDEAVVLTLSDGSTINIPIASAFRLVIPKTTYVVSSADPFEVPYSVSAEIQGTVVDIFTDGNYEGEVHPDKFIVTPKARVKGSALAYADSQVGLTSIVKLTFDPDAQEEEEYSRLTDDPASETYDYLAEATESTVEAHIVSNASVDVKSDTEWITVQNVKATNYTITLAVAANPTEEIRTGSVKVYSAGTDKVLQTITVAQKAKEEEPVEMEYYNPTGWEKVFDMSNYKTNSTFMLGEGLDLNPSNLTLQWKFYSNKWNNHKFNDRDADGNQLYANRLGEFANSDESKAVLLRFSNDGDADGQLCLNAGALGLNQVQIAKDNKPYVWATGEWVVFTLVADGSKLSIYDNDQLVAAYDYSPAASWNLARFDLSMTWDDGSNWPRSQAFNGYTAYTRVWSRALGQEEIAAGLCEVPASGREGLEIEWKFDGSTDKWIENSVEENDQFVLDFTDCMDGNGNNKDNSDAAVAAWTTLAGSDVDGLCSRVAGSGGETPDPEEPEQPSTDPIKAIYWGNKDASAWYKAFPSAISLPDAYSVTIHFYYDAAKPQRLANFGDASEAPCNMLRFGQAGNNNQLEWMVDTGAGRKNILASVDAVPGQWNAVTLTAGADGYKMYINGEAAASDASAYREGTSFQAIEFANSWGDSYRSAFDGAMAYISVWNTQLSAEEVAANVFTVPSGNGLQLFWKMTEGEGFVFTESAGVKEHTDYVNYDIDLTYMTRCNDESSYVDFDASPYVEWKEYPALEK